MNTADTNRLSRIERAIAAMRNREIPEDVALGFIRAVARQLGQSSYPVGGLVASGKASAGGEA